MTNGIFTFNLFFFDRYLNPTSGIPVCIALLFSLSRPTDRRQESRSIEYYVKLFLSDGMFDLSIRVEH